MKQDEEVLKMTEKKIQPSDAAGEAMVEDYRKLIPAGGEMGELIRNYNWAATPIGPIEAWPDALLITVSTLLNSRFGMFLWWGPDHIQFYNDAYLPSFGDSMEKHPYALGRPAKEVWHEIWPDISPKIHQVLATGIATYDENQLLPIYRNNILENVYWTYSYSPVYDKSGEIHGVLVVETETTKSVISQRRSSLLLKISNALKGVTEKYRIYEELDRIFSEGHPDVPYYLFFENLGAGAGMQLAGSAGRKEYPDLWPQTSGTLLNSHWQQPVDEAMRTNTAKIVTLPLASENAAQKTAQAYVIPLNTGNARNTSAVLIAGINPHQPADAEYLNFLESIAQQCTLAFANTYFATSENERRQEVEQLKNKSEIAHQKLLSLFMQAPVAIAIYRGPQYIIEFANPAVCEFWGRPYEKVINRPLFEALPEAAEQGFEELLNQVYQTGKTVEASEVSVILERNGKNEKVFFNLILHALTEVDKKTQDIVVIANEITDQVVVRKKVEESEQKYRTLFSSIDQGFCIIELIYDGNKRVTNYKFLEVNPSFERQTGLKNATGRTMMDLVPMHEKYWFESYQKVLETGIPMRFENYSGGLGHHFDVYAFRVGDPSLKRVSVIFTDITERKMLEMRKDDFISIASHELKTPITSIKAYAQLLEMHFDKQKDVGAASLIHKMDRQVNKLTTLINDLLDITKMESGRMQFHYDLFDLNEFIDGIVGELQPTCTSHKIQVEKDEAVMVNGDRDRLGQVLTNFLTNACKYSPGSDKVIVRSVVSNNEVTVSVKDFGTGIQEEHQKKVFDRFYRVVDEKANTYSGLGLGLYICREIIERHKGSIWVKSTLGAGSEFYFSIPLRQIS